MVKEPCKDCTPYCPEHYTGAMREPMICPSCGRRSYLLGLNKTLDNYSDRLYSVSNEVSKINKERDIEKCSEKANKVELPKSVRGYSLLGFLKLIAVLDYDFGRFEDAKDLKKSHRIEGVRARYEILNEWIKALELVRERMGE